MRLLWQTGLLLTTLCLLGIAPHHQAITFQGELSGPAGFGQVVASANNLLVSGIPYASESAGAVQIYERTANGEWDSQTELTAGAAAEADGFGMALAASDGLVVAGAPFSANGTGAVYVFERDAAGDWHESTRLVASDAAQNANFGMALSASENRIVVGAPGHGTSGTAYVFNHEGNGWVEAAKLTPFDVTAQFGAAVAIDDDQIIVGAPQDNMGAGAAYVFLNTTNQWQVAAKLISADASDGDRFGTAVAISGIRTLVGAPQVDADVEDAGAAYVFVRARNAWTEETRLTGATGQFGQAVALADNLALIGIPGANTAQVYTYAENSWQATDEFAAALAGDHIGGTVAITGSTLSIGAMDSVQVYIVPGVTGSLSLNTDNLVAGESFGIELTDPDLNKQPTQTEITTLQVTTTSGEQETLTLTETDIDSGIFAGGIESLATTTPRTEDHVLDLQAGDTIIVTYIDMRTETGATITVQTEANVSAPTQTPTPANTSMESPVPSATDTATMTATEIPTTTDTATVTATNTVTATDTQQPSATPTDVPSATPTSTDTSTPLPTNTATTTPTPPNGTTGILSVQPEFVQPGAAVVIALEDQDLNQDPQAIDMARVVVSSDDDTEALLLSETDMDTGTFITTVETRAGTAIPNNGILNVVPGDILTITYEDAQTAANQTMQIMVTRRIVAEFYVVKFVLVDTDTNEDLLTISNGLIIDLAQLPTRRLSVRAETQPAEIGSVVFELNNGLVFKVENRAPYALAGDNPIGGLPVGDYNPVDALIVGQHRLIAVPYSAANAAENQGTGLVVEFSITDSAAN